MMQWLSPKDCSEVQLAHEFINFMISDESALSNTEEVGYTSTVKSAYEDHEGWGLMQGLVLIFRISTNPNNEIFAYQQPKIKQKFAELLDKGKSKVKKDSHCLPIRWKMDSD